MLPLIEKDDAYRAREQRALVILRRLRAAHYVRASVRAINPAGGAVNDARYTRGAGEPNPRQDWMASVFNALRRGAGDRGTRVLVAVLLHQQASDAVAAQLRITERDVTFIYSVALHGFLGWMDRYRIGDHYRPASDYPPAVARCAARENGEACTLAPIRAHFMH